jgi:hypothetical protein
LETVYRDASIGIDSEISAVMRYPVLVGHRGALRFANIIQSDDKS